MDYVLSYFCSLLCCISVLSSARIMSYVYVLLIISSRHGVSLIIIARCYCHHGVRYFVDYQISMLLSSRNMPCWLSALAMTCFADYHNSVLLLTWRPIFRLLSDLSAPFYMKYVLLIIGSRHDVFRWLLKLCTILIMASDISLIIRAVCSLFHEICFADYQLSLWHVSLIITPLCYSRHGVRYFADFQSSMLHSPWSMSCWLSAVAVICFADYHSSVLLCHGVR
jgi:hypothetical protein